MGKQSTYQFPFASLPALRIALLLIAGLLTGYWLDSHLSMGVITSLFAGMFILWSVLEARKFDRLIMYGISIKTGFYFLLIILFGACLAIFERSGKKELRIQTEPLQLFEWEEFRVKATISEKGRSSSGRIIYGIDVTKTIFDGIYTWHQPYRLRIYSDEHDAIPDNHTELDAIIRLYEFPKKRNPHEFDYGKWLIEHSYAGHGDLQRVLQSNGKSAYSWQAIRTGVFKNIEQLFDEEHRSLAKALLTGYKDELTAEEKASFSRSGLSHIMAVSGMHVGFVVAPFWFIIPWLWRWRWGKLTGIVILTALLTGYAGLTGFSASVCRASIMAWLLTYGKLFHQIRHSVNLLACAALILLVGWPSQLFDIGFQLSFSAVLIILLLMPEAQKMIPERIRFDWRGGLITIILISIIVQAGLFPILTAYFGEFSIVGPIANALVVPALSLVVPAGLLISLLGGLFEASASLLAKPIGFALWWIAYVADNLGGNRFSFITVTETSVWIFMVWIFGIAVAASARIPWVRWKMVILLLIALNIGVADAIRNGSESGHLIVTVLDVGQGDAIHVETPGGMHFMVDMGRWSPGGNSGDRLILPYLESRGIHKLDAILLSHPHADHIGGLPAVLETIQADVIYQSDYHYDSNLYREYRSIADSKKIPVVIAKSGDIIDIDPAIRIFVVGPEAGSGKTANVNNHSMAFRMDYGATSFLFTGDAEERQEIKMAQKYQDFLDVNVLKVGHHGSKTSSSEFFVSTVKPDIAVVSLGLHNRFRHPNREAVTNLHRAGAKKYFTSLSGALIFKSNGETISPIYD